VVPCTPEPTWTRKIMPSSAILRASSDVCGCPKPAGSTVEPATGPGTHKDMIPLKPRERAVATQFRPGAHSDILACDEGRWWDRCGQGAGWSGGAPPDQDVQSGGQLLGSERGGHRDLDPFSGEERGHAGGCR
jgi:hypothetical protein